MMIGNLLKNVSLAATATTAILGIFANSSSALTLNNSSGTWTDTVGGSGVNYQTVGSENQVRWGTPGTTAGQSGLGFTGVGSTTFNPGDSFLLGTLRHFNNVISGGAANQTKLNVNLNFSDPVTNQTFGFDLAIDETSNTAPCPYTSTTPCSDKISFPSAFPGNSFNIAGTDYTLQLLGFSDTLGGTLVSDFISQEGGTNSTFLYGKITTVTPTPPATSVPEPSTGAALLVLGALGFGKAIKRKNNSSYIFGKTSA